MNKKSLKWAGIIAIAIIIVICGDDETRNYLKQKIKRK